MINDNFLLIPLYAHKEEEYDSEWERKFERTFHIKNRKYDKNQINEFRDFQIEAYPQCYFNDIIGYAILYVHDKDILIKYYLNCDKRKTYNRNSVDLKCRKIYMLKDKGYIQGNVVVIFEYNNKTIKKSFCEVLNILDKQCKEWKIYFDKESYTKKIKCFDFKKYWNID